MINRRDRQGKGRGGPVSQPPQLFTRQYPAARRQCRCDGRGQGRPGIGHVPAHTVGRRARVGRSIGSLSPTASPPSGSVAAAHRGSG